MMAITSGLEGRGPTAGTTLFVAMFAAQTPLFVLAPLIPQMAADLSVPVSALGEARAVAGLAAAVGTLFTGFLGRRLDLRHLLVLGLLLVAAGSVLTAASTGLPMLDVAHAALGLGLAVVLTAALAASWAWAPPEGRRALLSRAMTGPPAAAIVAALAAGLLARVGWRVTWLVVPAALSGAAALVARARQGGGSGDASASPTAVASAWRLAGVRAWALGELAAYSAWSAVVVFSGALLIQSYAVSPATAALAISASAAAFIVGNRIARDRVPAGPGVLGALALAMVPCGAALGVARDGFWASAALLTLLGALAGARGFAANARGLALAGGRAGDVMAVRTTMQQLGYLVGGVLGGTAIGVAGYAGLGGFMAGAFLLAALPHLWVVTRSAAGRTMTITTHPRLTVTHWG